MSLKHTKVSAVADDPAADVKPSDWNADHVVDTDGLLMVSDATTPSTPAAGYMTLFATTKAGGLPAFLTESGYGATLQPFFGRNKIALWMPQGNGNATTAVGIASPTPSGTTTGRNVSATSFFTSLRRVGVVSSAVAGNVARFTTGGISQNFLGDGSGKGGFRFVFRWGCSDAATVAGARTFVGICPTAFSNVEPSSLVSMIGVGTDAADTNLQIMHNDGSGTATKVDLGANFPDHTLSVDAYELVLFCAPSASTVDWIVTRLNTGDVASGTISTNLPASTTMMSPQFGRNNNTTALAVGIDMIGMYSESEN